MPETPLEPPTSAELRAFVKDLAAVIRKHGIGLDPGAHGLWGTADEELGEDFLHELVVVPVTSDRLVVDLRRAIDEGEEGGLLHLWEIYNEQPLRPTVFTQPSEVPRYGHFYTVRRNTGMQVGSHQILGHLVPETPLPDHIHVSNKLTGGVSYAPSHEFGFGDTPEGSINPLVAVDPVTFELYGYETQPEQLTLKDEQLGI